MKGINLILFWIIWAFGGSFIFQIILGGTSIGMIKQALTTLLLAGIWETTIGDYFRNKEKMQKEPVVASTEE